MKLETVCLKHDSVTLSGSGLAQALSETNMLGLGHSMNLIWHTLHCTNDMESIKALSHEAALSQCNSCPTFALGEYMA